MLSDLLYAIRTLRKNPGFTALAVAALALGIGGNAAMFSVVDAVLLRPLPYQDSGRLVMVSESHRKQGEQSASWLDFLDWRAQTHSFTGMAAITGRSFTLTGAGQPERLEGFIVSASLFHLLGIKPMLGRDFLPSDDTPGSARVVILSHALWQRSFSADPSIIGKNVMLNGRPSTAAGVLPAGFQFLYPGDVYLPIGLVAKELGGRGNHPGIEVLARRKAGVSVEQARADMLTVSAHLERQYPESNSGVYATVKPLGEYVSGPSLQRSLFALLCAVGFVLLIACANVANLLLARAASRRREIAIRSALGAGRARLVRQMLVESLLLAGLGAAGGLMLAWWSTGGLRVLLPENIGRINPIHINAAVLAFVAGVSILTAVLFGLAPAFQSARADIQQGLKESARNTAGGFRGWSLRSVLVAGEMALALVLLTGAGLTFRSLLALESVNPGFRADRLLTMRLALPGVRYPKEDQQVAFFDRLLARISSTPGVRSASGSYCIPLDPNGCWASVFLIGGKPVPSRENIPSAYFNAVEPAYFHTMGIPILRGRDFNWQDIEGRAPVVVVSEGFARKYLPGEDPIGKTIKQDWPEGNGPYMTIVGIVGDVRRNGLDDPRRAEVYKAVRQIGPDFLNLVIRANTSSPLSLVSAIRRQTHDLDPELPLFDIHAMDYYFSAATAPRRYPMLLLSIFAGIALLLSSVGIYGVMSFLVAQRTQEVGIRMALGARVSDVLRMVLGYGLRLVSLGVIVGLVGAWALTRSLESLLFGVRPTDPLTFIAVSAILTAVALLACYIPARRAAKVDPMVALRDE